MPGGRSGGVDLDALRDLALQKAEAEAGSAARGKQGGGGKGKGGQGKGARVRARSSVSSIRARCCFRLGEGSDFLFVRSDVCGEMRGGGEVALRWREGARVGVEGRAQARL